MTDHGFDLRGLDAAWAAQWPRCRPLGHELRDCAPDRWVRFHSLPESKRYPESDAEYVELLRRHNTTIADLLSLTPPTRTVIVVTCSWSDSPDPVPRNAELDAVSPAEHWQSILREVDDEAGEFWVHLYVEGRAWRPGELDGLLVLVADFGTSDVIVASPDFSWLYHPYDGGADVLAPSTTERDALRERHAGWLSAHPRGL